MQLLFMQNYKPLICHNHILPRIVQNLAFLKYRFAKDWKRKKKIVRNVFSL